MRTSSPLRVQAIRSRGQDPRRYMSFPLALAAAIGLEPGEEVQGELPDRGELHLVRPNPATPATKSRAAKQAPHPIIKPRCSDLSRNRSDLPAIERPPRSTIPSPLLLGDALYVLVSSSADPTCWEAFRLAPWEKLHEADSISLLRSAMNSICANGGAVARNWIRQLPVGGLMWAIKSCAT